MRSTPAALSRSQSSGSTPAADTFAPAAQSNPLPTPPTGAAATSAAGDAAGPAPKKGFVAGLRTAFAAMGSAAKSVYSGVVDFFALVGKEISYGVGLLFAKLTGRAQAFKTTQKAAAKAAYAKASARTNEYMAEQKAKAESLRTKFAKTADKTRGKMISDINQSFAKTIDELDSAVAEFTRTDSQTSSLPLSTAPSSMAKKDQ